MTYKTDPSSIGYYLSNGVRHYVIVWDRGARRIVTRYPERYTTADVIASADII